MTLTSEIGAVITALRRDVADLHAQKVGEIEFVLVRLGEAVAGDVQLQAAQGVGLFLGGDLLGPADDAVLVGPRRSQGQGHGPIGAQQRAVGGQGQGIGGEGGHPHFAPHAEAAADLADEDQSAVHGHACS